MKLESDVIIIGAGPVGCVLAHKITKELKLNCLILEKRNHIAGNCYDEYNSSNPKNTFGNYCYYYND